jgi:hypothetical protein
MGQNVRWYHVMATLGAVGALTLTLHSPIPTRAADRRPHYTDVAPRSKFSYVSNNGFTGRKYFPQSMCGGVAILDYDNDGMMDIFFTNGAAFPEMRKADSSFFHSLLRNKGDGTFDDVTQKAGLAGESLGYSFGAAAGDYDNDGYTDLIITNAGDNTLYRNNGNGTFTDVTAGSGLGTKPTGALSVQAAWIDYDNDGLLDLVIADYTVWTPGTDRRCLRGDRDMYCSPKTYTNVPQRLYRNVGRGRFEDVTEKSGFGTVSGKGMGIAIADVNNDGWMDVFIANDTERNLLFLNQGGGHFKEAGLTYGVAYNDHGATVSAMGCDIKDIDNDGWPDVFYNDLMGQIWGLFRNRAGKTFQYISPNWKIVRLSEPYSGWSSGFIDYNNDGWKDLFSANGDVDNLTANSAQHDTLFENIEGREFADVSGQMGGDFLRTGYQRGSAIVDLNNDGFLDIVVTSLHQKPRILLNSGGNGGHWLLIETTGFQSNRDGIGAKLKLITSSGRVLYNHVTTAGGFLSSNDRRVHFGLGSETGIRSLEIRWPSGTVQTLTDVKSDRIVRIQETR